MLERIRDLSYVILLCGDLPAMRSFYTGVMKFPVYSDYEDWVELRVGSTLLALRPRGRHYDGPAPAGASVQLAFRVAPDEVEACEKALAEQDVHFLEPVTSQDYGHKTLIFKDPENNILEIYADIPVKQYNSLLSALTMEQVLEISPHCELKEYAPDSIIVRQGDVADKFYIITQGRVQVINHTDTGQDLMIGWLHEGEYFGEVGLLQSHPRTATIKAQSGGPVKVISIDREGFSELISESEAASSDVSKAMYDRLMEMAGIIIKSSNG